MTLLVGTASWQSVSYIGIYKSLALRRSFSSCTGAGLSSRPRVPGSRPGGRSYSNGNPSNSQSSSSGINKQLASNITHTMSQINKDKYLSNSKTTALRHSENNEPSDLKVSGPFNNSNPLLHTTDVDKAQAGTAKGDGGVASDNSGKTAVSNDREHPGRRSNGFDGEDMIRMESFFDSYKVVQDFKNSGFTDAESLLLMKYTYHILQKKLDWLSQTYAPKVDLENEAYLFEAAHSELLFEVTNSREISLMNLTNAMIILKRAFNNLDDETIAQIKLNDDIIKMEVNQFKHENNLHQKSLNLKNSDLNSRILSDMVSGLKSEIETFRWQLTRAGILSIMVMAICIMGVWNLTKKLAMGDDAEHENKGPLLQPVHQQTDEESHDYEADWDEPVVV